jgi:WNK lysine deficient protein kinase
MAEAEKNHLEDQRDHEEDGHEVVETDPEGRYYCYRELVGRGKFKACHKAFDSQIGIDVAWSKIAADNNHLSERELHAVVQDIQKGLDLEHPNIIKCFKCWEDTGNHCINLITELFTSGNLRQYRILHKHLDMKAVKRMGRQILRGLQYLHSMEPAITHGDLRCDKIYVNGHSGEIKIGDLGLATLMPYRWDGTGERPQPLPMNSSSDIFAFGLCILELLTLKQLDPQHCSDWQQVVAEVADEDARAFITKCLENSRPDADELLEDPFLSSKKSAPEGSLPQPQPQPELDSSLNVSSKSLHDVITATKDRRSTDDVEEAASSNGSGAVAVGKLRGEDYIFEFAGKVKDGKMHFRLVMTQAVPESSETTPPFMRTIDFVFDPDDDTVDKLASEISETFNLSPTDTEICAAALREWLAKEMPTLIEQRNDG